MGNTKKRYSFKISIKMDSNSKDISYTKNIPYMNSRSYFDKLTIKDSEISIKGDRSAKPNFDEIFYNHMSILYTQIIKSILAYYCLSGIICKISEINFYDDSQKLVKSIGIDEINNVTLASRDFTVLKDIDFNKMNVIFDDSKKGKAFFISLSHFIRSFCMRDSSESFEKLWKSFNAIYKEISGKESDNDCHKHLRRDMVQYPQNYPLIAHAVTNLTSKEIRDKTRWNKMILNDYKTETKTKAFKCFILRNDDFRLMEICKESLPVREDFLKSSGLYEIVNDHIENKLENKTVNDMQVAATLCIKYMYYVRNKLMHGEQMDSGFRLKYINKQEESMNWCSSLLKMLVIDIYNSNDLH